MTKNYDVFSSPLTGLRTAHGVYVLVKGTPKDMELFPQAVSLQALADSKEGLIRVTLEGDLNIALPNEDYAPVENPVFSGEGIVLPAQRKEDMYTQPLEGKVLIRFVEDL